MQNPTHRLSVFLSHASDDKPAIRQLYQRLIEKGFDVWLDEKKLIPGQVWNIEIQKAVQNSDAIIICLTRHSITKEGYVQKEIRAAIDKAKEKPEGTIFLIPARLEECEIPFRLKKYQYVDLYAPDGFSKLVQALQIRTEDLHHKERKTTSLPIIWKQDKTYSRHTYHINSIHLTPNDQLMVSCSGDHSAIVWEVGSGEVVGIFKHDRWVGSVRFIGGKSRLVTSDGNGFLRIWNFRQQNLVMKKDIHVGPCRTLSYSKSKNLLASGGGDHKIKLWALPQVDIVATLEGHSAEVRRVAFSSSGLFLVSGGEDGKCILWDVKTQESKIIFEEPFNIIRSVAISKDEKFISAVDSSGKVFVWDRIKQDFLWKKQLHDGPAIGLAYHPNNTCLATSGQDKKIHIWKISDASLLVSMIGHEDSVTSLTFSSKGNKLFSTSRDKSIRCWNVEELLNAGN